MLERKTGHSEIRQFNVDMNQEVESRIIEMAWEDRTPFEAIEFQFGLNESDVIRFMCSGQVKLATGL